MNREKPFKPNQKEENGKFLFCKFPSTINLLDKIEES